MLTRENVDAVFAAFTSRDLVAVMRHFAEDAMLIDPHYPQPRMVGREAIERGLAWGLGSLVKPGFTIRHIWLDGDTAAIEMDTHHVFKGGLALCFDQFFVIEARDGKITRLQAYVPYGPPGVAGLLARLTRWAWWLQSKLRS
ncbi:MAG: nuclear transport factor 2 family protein [Hydrogenophaga sp.]|nr:nuclear transport factor 2 family protein [Hydrogenophaga sp.]